MVFSGYINFLCWPLLASLASPPHVHVLLYHVLNLPSSVRCVISLPALIIPIPPFVVTSSAMPSSQLLHRDWLECPSSVPLCVYPHRREGLREAGKVVESLLQWGAQKAF